MQSTITKPLLLACLASLPLGGCSGCPDTTSTPTPREGQPNVTWCPGSPSCLDDGEAQVYAGVGRRSILPRGFEIANARYLEATGCDPVMAQRYGVDRCGVVVPQPRDCGTDALCVGDDGYVAPDGDGSQGDGKPDWFHDCGLDRLCPGAEPERDDPGTTEVDESDDGVDNDGDGAVDEGAYPGPDPDGTEGNGKFEGAWIAGYSSNRPSVGVLDEPNVRCMALRAAQTTVVLCSADTIGLFYDEIERARALAKQRHPEMDLDYLAVSSTHTHESVDTMGQWGRADPVPLKPGNMPGHNAYIVEQVVAAAAEAVESLRPATLLVTSVDTGREGFMRDSRDPQVLNDTLSIVEARERDSTATIFTALNWSNHPEVLDSDNNLLSSDFPDVVRRAVEDGLPADGPAPALAGRGGTAIYFSGSVGGLLTPANVDLVDRAGRSFPGNRPTLERLEAFGEKLAQVALQAIDDAEGTDRVDRAVLRLKAERFMVPVENPVLKLAFAIGLFDRSIYDDETGDKLDPTAPGLLDYPFTVQSEVFTLEAGAFSIVGLPGEMFSETVVGGFDGSRSLGRDVVAADYCPAQESCTGRNGAECPVQRPDAGWTDCQCEACRYCAPPDLAAGRQARTTNERVGGRVKMALGLCNDEMGYLVPAYDWKVSEVSPYTCQATDHYEETNSLGPLTLTRITEALDRLSAFSL